MGNLYTQLVRQNNPRVGILWELKLAWKTKPVDYKLIKQLQDKLQRIENNIQKRKIKRKRYVGQYG